MNLTKALKEEKENLFPSFRTFIFYLFSFRTHLQDTHISLYHSEFHTCLHPYPFFTKTLSAMLREGFSHICHNNTICKCVAFHLRK